MRLRHPFEWLSHAGQRRAFIPLLALTVILMASLQALGRPLTTAAAPAGIVSFEVAGDLSDAQRMLESWGPIGRIYAGLNLGLDYLFLVVYASAIGVGCVLVSRRLSGWRNVLGTVGIVLAWGQVAAGLLDGIENYALIQVLLGTDQGVWPVVARWCAVPKFLIVAAGLAYLVIGGLIGVVRRP